jgi:hypothetical protein
MLSVRLLTYVCTIVLVCKTKLNEVGEIRGLLKYFEELMSVLAKLVLSHKQSVNTPTEHKPNLLRPVEYKINPPVSVPLQSNSGLLIELDLAFGKQ